MVPSAGVSVCQGGERNALAESDALYSVQLVRASDDREMRHKRALSRTHTHSFACCAHLPKNIYMHTHPFDASAIGPVRTLPAGEAREHAWLALDVFFPFFLPSFSVNQPRQFHFLLFSHRNPGRLSAAAYFLEEDRSMTSKPLSRIAFVTLNAVPAAALAAARKRCGLVGIRTCEREERKKKKCNERT